MALGIHFDSFDSLSVPVPSPLGSLDIDVELIQEVLDIALVIDGYKTSIEVLGEGRIIVVVSLAWWLSASSTAW